ncbi:PelA/Pel-15E family pectate lyase [Salegentibacter sp. 24]|jgi:PelA/Pel-15E family pectate lyase|uniref:pectate lyase n=1 Tax=Salegentibacter sp. 24 TaxID=2183986 RepID=UPI00105D168D|nr:pectate lyase [Salegentibacter sp. 24]TDN95428.1 PelA/Pel-15E family pectate lyase [Salegentibacter sp. 24]
MANKITKENKLFTLICLLVSALFLQAAQSQEQTVSWKEAQRQDIAWYGSEEAIRIAENVLLYQHSNGGWLKNIAMAGVLGEKEKQVLREEKSKEIGTTIDNGATHTQLRYLAKVYSQTQKDDYRQSFLKGVDYLLEAQYKNGGWPQFFPLKEGYYEHITFNDNAMMGVMFLFSDILNRKKFAFVDTAIKEKIRESIEKGEEVILKMQIRIDGKPTLWCAQHHSKDLSPAKARSYELPSLSGSESVGIVKYLMTIENPSQKVITAVKSAVAWFEKHKIEGKNLVYIDAPELEGGKDRVVVKDEKADPLWARFNEIGTGRPMFVGRDGVVEDSLEKIAHERRMGYSYLGNYANDLLNEAYPNWLKRISYENH